MTTPFVQYAYANGSANTVRPESVTYPDGRVISQDYGTADGMSDAASRVASIVDDDNTHLADYSYLGERSFVVADSPEPQVKWTLASLSGSNDPDTGDIYTGLDRFGRVKDNRWYDYGSSADVDRIQNGYDRAGNRTWRQNTVAEALSKPYDELYGNDLIHRLKQLSRGILNGSKDAVTDQSFGECWSLDATGNWQKYLEDTNGDGNWDLNQARTANTVNEITGITESAGPSWATPAYSAAGNMTTVPQPADPTRTYTATYDAWNRLVKLVDADTSDTVAEYQYDGANRRTVQKSYVGGVLDETRHLYYTQPSQWQVVEERVDAEEDPDRQFVWGLRYIDDLILRDRDTNGDGSLDERLYALQDANWNVDAIVDTSGDVQERHAYSAYGTPLFLTSAFVPQGNSSFDWETLYAGYRWETATELFHVRHRVLNSVIGTWLQRDPLHEAFGSNLYEYALSTPLQYVDPDGLVPITCWCYDGYYRKEFVVVSENCRTTSSICCNIACRRGDSGYRGLPTGVWHIFGESRDVPPPSGGHGGRYYGVEIGALVIGFGVVTVVCCDPATRRLKYMPFTKVCGPGSIGAKLGGGLVYLYGGCVPDTYRGWFGEFALVAGAAGVGGDVGLIGIGPGGIVPTPLPSGTFEAGASIGFQAKFAGCYYFPTPGARGWLTTQCCTP